MDIAHLLQQGSGNAWLFIPSAILLGALHGLEPGHSKTMMAAFIIAVRGTILQALLLGLSAALSHSLVIWVMATVALHYGGRWSAETSEPYFQIGSGAMILGLAAWMFWRTRKERVEAEEYRKQHEKEGPHGGPMEETPAGLIELSIFEDGVPPRFRVHFFDAARKPRRPGAAQSVMVETRRTDGSSDVFRLEQRHDAEGEPCFESTEEIPEPHEFTAIVTLAGPEGAAFELAFSEDHHHHHHADLRDLSGDDYASAHEQAHAADIARRFTNRSVTTPQIVWFGITGGLMPCPAAFTILIVCLQLKRFTLGFTLVGSFSLGLALTMMATGALAAWGVRRAERQFKGFGEFAQRAPYASALLLTALAAYFIYEGARHLA